MFISLYKILPGIGCGLELGAMGLTTKNADEKLGELDNPAMIKRLNLSSNDLTSWPRNILRLSSLTELNLSYNHIRQVPKRIKELNALQTLNLSSNHLDTVPKEVFRLPGLMTLNLSDNRLKFVPKQMLLPKLHTLDLGNNKLTFVPPNLGNITSLTHLYLDMNKITQLPERVFDLGLLKKFHLYNNPIFRCRSLTPTWRQC